MSVFDDMRTALNSGLKESRKVLDTATARVRRLGDESVTSLDIKQLRAERDKITRELGELVYAGFSNGERKSVSQKTPGVRELVEELDQVSAAIEEKEAALSALRNERKDGEGL